MDTSTPAGGDEQLKRVADDEGRDEEGGEGEGNNDEVGGRAKATMVKKRARATRVMVSRVVSDEEGGRDGGSMARNNDDGLILIVVQQAVHSASASLDAWATTSQPDDDWCARCARTMSATTKRRQR